MKIKKIKFNFDLTLIFVPLLLSVAGLATIYSIATIAGKTSLFYNQIVFLVAGAIVYALLAMLDYHELKYYKWYLLLGGIILLGLVAIFGQEIFGSKRWIDLGFFQFQPSEFMKVIFLIFLAGYLSESNHLSIRKAIFIIMLATVPVFLILKQPDLGTALTVVSIVIATLVAAKAPRALFLTGFALLIIASPIVYHQLMPYQKLRVTTFFNPSVDPLGSGYNVTQSKIAVGSGGLYGRGFGGATQSQLQFLPVAYIDFIFSGWSEMTGFVGSVLMVLAFAVLVWRILAISSVAKDSFGEIFCTGAGIMIFFQSFVNIGMNIGVMPVTGIPLPFVSSGGTSIITTAAILGIVQSIYLRRKTLKFD